MLPSAYLYRRYQRLERDADIRDRQFGVSRRLVGGGWCCSTGKAKITTSSRLYQRQEKRETQ
jgi:hypothetical protein